MKKTSLRRIRRPLLMFLLLFTAVSAGTMWITRVNTVVNSGTHPFSLSFIYAGRLFTEKGIFSYIRTDTGSYQVTINATGTLTFNLTITV